MAKRLNPEILKTLQTKLGYTVATIRVGIAKIRTANPSLTLNASASEYAKKRGFSVMQRLDDEDRKSLSNSQTTTVIHKEFGKKTSSKKATKISSYEFIKYSPKNNFQRDHIKEINNCYNAGCYTAAMILCRKVIENLVIDLLIKQFPASTLANEELYYRHSQNRFNDFSETLDNLHKKKTQFPILARAPIDRLHGLVKPFAKNANNKTHSWYHISSKKELDEVNVQNMIDLIVDIDNKI